MLVFYETADDYYYIDANELIKMGVPFHCNAVKQVSPETRYEPAEFEECEADLYDWYIRKEFYGDYRLTCSHEDHEAVHILSERLGDELMAELIKVTTQECYKTSPNKYKS